MSIIAPDVVQDWIGVTSMDEELKPVQCGCGGEAEICQKYLSGNLPDIYVLCGNCSIRTGEYYTEAEAIEAWNRAMGKRSGENTGKQMSQECWNADVERKYLDRGIKEICQMLSDGLISEEVGFELMINRVHRNTYVKGKGTDVYCEHCGFDTLALEGYGEIRPEDRFNYCPRCGRELVWRNIK